MDDFAKNHREDSDLRSSIFAACTEAGTVEPVEVNDREVDDRALKLSTIALTESDLRKVINRRKLPENMKRVPSITSRSLVKCLHTKQWVNTNYEAILVQRSTETVSNI